MSASKTIADLKETGTRLALHGAVLLGVAACTLIGHQIFTLTQDTSLHGGVNGVLSGMGSLAAALDLNGTAAMVLVPGLIVSGMTLGGMYLWGRRA
jgi:hypothetical protein